MSTPITSGWRRTVDSCDAPNRYEHECFHAGFTRWGLRLRGQCIRFEYGLADVLAGSRAASMRGESWT